MGHTENRSDGVNISRFLNFCLGDEQYALPLLDVREVIGMPAITPLPQTPTYFLGVMNLRGKVIPVLDLRSKLNIKGQNTPELSVIICDLGQHSFGFVVDSIARVLAVENSKVSARPDVSATKNAEWITGIYEADKKLVLLMDATKLLSVEDRNAVRKSTEPVGAKAA